MVNTLQNDWIPGLLVIVALIIAAIVAVLIFSTQPDESLALQDTSIISNESRDLFSDKAYPLLAKGFSVEYHGTYKVVHITEGWGKTGGNHTYLLVQRGESIPVGYSDAEIISVPVTRVVTTSSLQLPFIISLHEISSIIAHSGIKSVFSEDFQNHVSSGNVVDIGKKYAENMEQIASLKPDVVFCRDSDMNPDEYYKFKEIGIIPVVNIEWLEKEPLARAEWIKYYSLFYNQEKVANEVFNQINYNYSTILTRTNNVTYRPSILSGINSPDSWLTHGGKSYAAQMFYDAGGNYLWKNNTDTGYLLLDFESVYELGHSADFWINIGIGDSYKKLLAMDPRYEKFHAFTKNKVFHFNNRTNEYGGNDYWESGVLNVDILLKDLVSILHPELFPDHQLYYYKRFDVNQMDNQT